MAFMGQANSIFLKHVGNKSRMSIRRGEVIGLSLYLDFVHEAGIEHGWLHRYLIYTEYSP